jgi:hypothetical protein
MIPVIRFSVASGRFSDYWPSTSYATFQQDQKAKSSVSLLLHFCLIRITVFMLASLRGQFVRMQHGSYLYRPWDSDPTVHRLSTVLENSDFTDYKTHESLDE